MTKTIVTGVLLRLLLIIYFLIIFGIYIVTKALQRSRLTISLKTLYSGHLTTDTAWRILFADVILSARGITVFILETSTLLIHFATWNNFPRKPSNKYPSLNITCKNISPLEVLSRFK